jgi:Domain of unknown function (DUF6894)
MAQYYFLFSDGKHTFSDSDGIDLPGIVAARAHARVQIRDIKAVCPIRSWSEWMMIVSDANGKIIAEINFESASVNDSPLMGADREF